jgi:lysophospholipase
MFKRGVLLALALALTACGGGDARAPFTESRIPPGLAQKFWPPEGWAWGLIQIGSAPPQRYGVLGPTIASRAQVLILPGYGDFAESWYATAADFAARGYTVWVLDGAGQGGSGRWTGARDLGHVPNFDTDAAAIAQMVAGVIRPQGGQPLVVIADGTAAPLALRAFVAGRSSASALILTSPTLEPPGGNAAAASTSVVRRIGLGSLRAPGAGGWDRTDPPGPRDTPEAIRHAWQTANPDLRMGGPSLSWLAAFGDLGHDVSTARAPAGAPQTIILADPRWAVHNAARWAPICHSMKDCVQTATTSADDAREREATFIETLLPKPKPVKGAR